jgi:dUTP diphosphatase|nr:MAG TPA: dUTPase [Caudoviricetes sp.]
MEQMKVKLVNEYAQLPTRGSKDAAGLDLYCPFDVIVPADSQKKIPLGIAIKIPGGCVGVLAPRSSLHKTPLRIPNSVGIIDSDYVGEICAIFDNVSCKDYTIKRGERIAQLIVMPIIKTNVIEVDDLGETERGENGFGSTGK